MGGLWAAMWAATSCPTRGTTWPVSARFFAEGDLNVASALAHAQRRGIADEYAANLRSLPRLPRDAAEPEAVATDRHRARQLRELLDHVEYLEGAIDRPGGRIAAALAPYAAHVEYLQSIPGVNRQEAETIIAEVGVDMTRFPTARHLASWAGICPGNHESAGKRRRGRTRKGSPWLRAALVEAARASARSQRTCLGAQYRRLAARRGAKRAVVAVGHTILVIAHHLLRVGTVYEDLGATYFDQRDRHAIARRLGRRLETLGYAVTLAPAA